MQRVRTHPLIPNSVARRRLHVRRRHRAARPEVLSPLTRRRPRLAGVRRNAGFGAGWRPRWPRLRCSACTDDPDPTSGGRAETPRRCLRRAVRRRHARGRGQGQGPPVGRPPAHRQAGARRPGRRRGRDRRSGDPAEGAGARRPRPAARLPRARRPPGVGRDGAGRRTAGHCAAWSATTSPRGASSGPCTASSSDTLPAWRIVAPAPAEELLRFYKRGERALRHRLGVPRRHQPGRDRDGPDPRHVGRRRPGADAVPADDVGQVGPR